MPHRDADQALEAALSLDIPFWPQLSRLNYYEDMYVQASEHFPGIVLNLSEQTLSFSLQKFIAELEDALAHFEDPANFDISPTYSAVYHRFLTMELADRPAIRGQLEGPISFGLNVLDQDRRPILFDDTVRPFLFDFMARRINVQLQGMKALNTNAFMFVDEPGLQFLFSALSGYDALAAKKDMDDFFGMVDRPCGVHLCGNPDWDFLLNLDVLSLDVFTDGDIFSNYAGGIKRFLENGGRLVWGMVPTNFEPFGQENIDSLENRLVMLWKVLTRRGIDRDFMLSRSLLSPATCCLVNPDGPRTVNRAFGRVNELSVRLREEFKLP